MKPLLSIIYVYYNTPEEIKFSLKSLTFAVGKISYEIIVVDNASVKNLPEELLNLSNVKIIKNTNNYGYGKGLNQGVNVARGKYVLLANPDLEFTLNSIKLLLDRMEKDKKVGVIGPQLIDNKGETLQSISGMPYLLQSLFAFSFLGKIWRNSPFLVKYHNLNLDRNKEHFVDVVSGACMLVRKSLFDRVGGFDERFFLYFEEADFCFRIKKTGYTTLYYPQAKIMHLVGKSTQDKEWIKKTFEQSRFRFFQKYHGLMPALVGELFLRFFKPTNILLLVILVLSAFLNFYKLSERMIFIGDQGWFYLSARDMLLTGKIPLVGITASHTWLHQGPFWTYILAFILLVSNYNPLSGGYFTALLGVTTTFFMYKVGKEMFSKRIGLISALLYATSPLVVINAQMPYHTSPIPLLTLGLIHLVFKWIKGDVYFFPIIIFFMALLYNFELATQVLWLIIGLIFIIGFIKKKKWLLGVLNKKILFLSVLFFILPMLPVIIYDFNHGFAQTLKFFLWIPYKVINQLFSIKDGSLLTGLYRSFISLLSFFGDNYKNLIFISNSAISLLILFLCVGCLVYFLLTKKLGKDILSPTNILLVFIAIPMIGFFVNATPSGSYIPLFFPSVIILTAWAFDKLMNKKYLLFPILILIFFIATSNILFIMDTVRSKPAYGFYLSERLGSVKTILKEADREKYVIKGEGPGSQFASFTMNYEYLAWWLGNPPSKNSVREIFTIKENKNGIIVKKILNK